MIDNHKSREALLRAFGSCLRREREKRGMSQEVLGHQAELDRSYVGGVERGERNISLINIVALARALRITPSTLLEGIDENEDPQCLSS